MKWGTWTILALGLWLIAAPFVLDYPGISVAVVNDGAFGAIIAGLAAWSMAAVAGLWVAVAPFLLGYVGWQNVYEDVQNAPAYLAGYESATKPLVNDLIVGVAVLALSVRQALTGFQIHD